MKRQRFLLLLISLTTIFSLLVALPNKIKIHDQEIPRPAINLSFGKFRFQRDLEIKKGLDLAGGVHLIYQADMSKIDAKDRDSALEATRANIERRVNLYGVSEPTIWTAKTKDEYRLVIELPGVENIDTAIDLIGQTAQLEFREEASSSATPLSFQPTDLTGRDLKRSQVQFDPNTGQPVVSLEFSAEGAKKFEEITGKNVGKMVGIFLDETPISLPRVEEPITGGSAIVRGNFTLDEAKRLSIQLNAGALPTPIKIIEQRNIGATLGETAVKKSVRAGLIGLSMVIFFMWAYYGYLGFLADVGLIVYGLVTLALYKLIPITLTLPGIAGFILSVGMAVDANILIFERIKEEKRTGQPAKAALELGFGRAWDSIRDANICTLITCFVLFNPFNWSFLNVSGMIRGFALTLGLGIGIGLFTGIVVTRTLLRSFYELRILHRKTRQV